MKNAEVAIKISKVILKKYVKTKKFVNTVTQSSVNILTSLDNANLGYKNQPGYYIWKTGNQT